jgi:hypothetical protein
MMEKTHRYVERLRETLRAAVENDIPLNAVSENIASVSTKDTDSRT